MTRICFSRFWLGFAVAALLGASTAACGDNIGLLPPTTRNSVDTVTLYALQGTPIPTPSAFDVIGNRAARTDLGESFDFAFDINAEGQAQILPASLFQLSQNAGLLTVSTPFDSLITAPIEGYVTDSAVTIEVGMTFVARSRLTQELCSYLGSLPRYGKFLVLAIDTSSRSVTFQTLVDQNCGYHDLTPGIPDN